MNEQKKKQNFLKFTNCVFQRQTLNIVCETVNNFKRTTKINDLSGKCENEKDGGETRAVAVHAIRNGKSKSKKKINFLTATTQN